MKTFNFTRILYTIIIGATLAISCSEENLTDKTSEVYTISLNLCGEISSTESPLCRGTNSDSDIYAVQVYGSGLSYCFGIFDKWEDVKIHLRSNRKYKFVVTVIKDGKNQLYYNGSYSFPLVDEYAQGYGISNSIGYIGNELEHLGSGKSKLVDGTTSTYPELDRFYGEYDNYIPTEDGTININLKRAAFGLQYEVGGITDGTVQITIKAYDDTILHKNSSISSDYVSEEKIFTFSDVYSSWLYADDYTETVTVSAKWIRDVGITQDLGSKNVQIKRNAMNIIRLKLSPDNGDNMIGIDVEEDNMNEENIEVSLTK